jgi:hypothetical protein
MAGQNTHTFEMAARWGWVSWKATHLHTVAGLLNDKGTHGRGQGWPHGALQVLRIHVKWQLQLYLLLSGN